MVPGYPRATDQVHRPSALTGRLLTQAGCEVSETTACGLGGGVGFLYAVFEYKQVDHPLLTVVAQHHPQPWFETAAAHLGVQTLTQRSSSSRAALAKLESALAEGHPAEVLVARGALPWHPDGDPVEAADPYAIVVAGVHEGVFIVDDLPGEPLEIVREDLVRAWAGHRKGRHAMTTVADTAGALDRPAALRRALAMTADHLTGPVLGNSFDVNFGLSGMAKLAGEMRDTRTRTGWARRFDDERSGRYVAGRLAECLTSAYTAPGGTRPLYAAFLREAATVLESGDLTRAASLFAESGAVWCDLADRSRRLAADPASGEPGPPGAVYAAMADLVDAAADLERQAVEAIRRELAG